MKKIKILFALTLLLAAAGFLAHGGAAVCQAADTDSDVNKLRIVLDPGHGGAASGAEEYGVSEKDINLKIAQYLKEELNSYENVEVSLTRTGDYDVDLENRSQYAVDVGADVLISLHNNATGDLAPYDDGCTVLAAKDGYKDALALEEQKLACNILNELSALGITDQGILLRDSESGDTYENGVLADYYAIIRAGVLHDIPSVLIEHAFLDDADDFREYLSSDEKLLSLARADARGIARYYGLAKKEGGETLEPLEDYREKLVHTVDGNAAHNKISYKTYYPKAGAESSEAAEEKTEEASETEEKETEGEVGETESQKSSGQAAEKTTERQRQAQRERTSTAEQTEKRKNKNISAAQRSRRTVQVVLGVFGFVALLILVKYFLHCKKEEKDSGE